jgi:iron(III) transport system substrate-binding protein
MLRQGMWVLAVLFMGCDTRETVVVYSPHGVEMLSDYEGLFEAAYPDVDLQWLDMGSQDVFSRVSAERNRPAGDVWWGAPCTMFMKAAEEGLLEPYRPTWAEAVPPDSKDPQDRWYATHRSPLAIVFNQRGLTKETAPQTWDELLDPKWHGRVSIRKPPASGTMRTFLCAMIHRAASEDAGIAWLKRLHEATESYPESPQFLFDHLKKNPELVSVWLMPDVVLQRERNGYPFDCVLPPGTPVLTEGIAIIRGAPHPEWARKFYEFVTTREALAQQSRAYAKMPARTDVEPAALPGWMVNQSVDAMPIDWRAFARNEQAWCSRWEKEVYASP